MWFRRSTVYQEGVFTTPKILYMTQTETEGGYTCGWPGGGACGEQPGRWMQLGLRLRRLQGR